MHLSRIENHAFGLSSSFPFFNRCERFVFQNEYLLPCSGIRMAETGMVDVPSFSQHNTTHLHGPVIHGLAPRVSKLSPRRSKTLVAQTGQHRLLHPGWKIIPNHIMPTIHREVDIRFSLNGNESDLSTLGQTTLAAQTLKTKV